MTVADEAAQAKTRWLAEQVQQDLPRGPELLWHYTDAQGLLSIVESGVLWATNTRYLNDATELLHGLDVARERLLAYAGKAGLKAGTVQFVRGVGDPDQADVTGFLRRHLDVYVTCFCEDGDLLSQWRAYAGRDSAGGYALGVGTRPPLQGWVQEAGKGHRYRLRRVLYNQDEQEAAVDSLLSHLVPILDAAPEESDRWDAVASSLAEGLVDFAVCCKHPAFAEEREWRIVYDRSSDQTPLDLHHRSGRGLLVPYVELELPAPVGLLAGHLPLKAINCGPGPEPALKQEGVRRLLEHHPRYSGVFVDGSPTPLRL